jgi:hypothetical protein
MNGKVIIIGKEVKNDKGELVSRDQKTTDFKSEIAFKATIDEAKDVTRVLLHLDLNIDTIDLACKYLVKVRAAMMETAATPNNP